MKTFTPNFGDDKNSTQGGAGYVPIGEEPTQKGDFTPRAIGETPSPQQPATGQPQYQLYNDVPSVTQETTHTQTTVEQANPFAHQSPELQAAYAAVEQEVPAQQAMPVYQGVEAPQGAVAYQPVYADTAYATPTAYAHDHYGMNRQQNRGLILGMFFAALAVFGILIVLFTRGGSAQFQEQKRTFTDELIVQAPRVEQKVTLPFEITGEARGFWFDDGVFPISVYDDKDQLVMRTVALAQQEWSDNEFVPFVATITKYDYLPTTKYGTILLHNSNPEGGVTSALQEAFAIPVEFNKDDRNGTRALEGTTINGFNTCSDGADNDGNGRFDIQDRKCHNLENEDDELTYATYQRFASEFDPNAVIDNGDNGEGNGSGSGSSNSGSGQNSIDPGAILSGGSGSPSGGSSSSGPGGSSSGNSSGGTTTGGVTPSENTDFTANLYFPNFNNNPFVPYDCSLLYPRTRTIAVGSTNNETRARAVLEELFEGPSTQDKNNGFNTWIGGARINGVELNGSTLDVYLSGDPSIDGLCSADHAEQQITRTLQEVPGVSSVNIID